MNKHVKLDICYQIDVAKKVLQNKIVFQNSSNTAEDHNVHFQPEQNLEK